MKEKNILKENLNRIMLSLFACSYGAISYGVGIIVDEEALSKHKSILKKTGNNIDQVDIARPNSRGLSHNKFLKFNVNNRGMILNNSSKMTMTDLAGLIYGNSNLEIGKEAKVILSEITGLTRSEIDGFIEIAGKEAEFILANPNGIYLSNGGFLNTSKVTLTTGKLVDEINENGGLLFKINDGEIELAKGGSINIAQVDFFNVISKAAKIGGALHNGKNKELKTKEIKMLTGSNLFNYETGEYQSEAETTSRYEYGIDASELGAMSAGKITLIATDKGVGVNSKGSLVAESGDINIDSKGNIILKNAISKKGNIKAKANGNFEQVGKNSLILAEEKLEIDATKDVFIKGNNGLVKGKNSIKISGKNIEVSGGSSIVSVDKDGSKEQKIEVVAENLKIYGEKSLIMAGKEVNINIFSKTEDGSILYKKENEIYNEGTIQGMDVKIKSGLIYNKSDILGNNKLEIISDKIDNLKNIKSGDELKISGKGSLMNLQGGEISSKNLLRVTGYKELLNKGKILSDGVLVIEELKALMNLKKGKIQATRSTSLISDSLSNEGNISSKDLKIISDNILNDGILYGMEIEVTKKTLGKGNFTNGLKGYVISEKSIKLLLDESFYNQGSVKGSQISIISKNLNNSGNIISEKEALKIAVTKNLNNAGTIISRKNIDIEAENIMNKITGTIFSGKYFDGDGNLLQELQGNRNLNLKAKIEIINEGNIGSLSDMNISAKEIINKEKGYIYSYNNININLESIKNKGNISSLKNINIQSKNLINLLSGRINSAENTKINSEELENYGEIIAAKNVIIEANKKIKNTGEILANKNIEINRKKSLGQMSSLEKKSASNLINSGTINASEKVLISADNLNNENGKIYSGQNIELDINSLNNIKGELVTNGDLKIDMTNVDNVNHGNIMDIFGKIYGDRLISIKNFNDIINNQINLMSNGNITLESVEKNIINSKKIIAGQALILKAKKGKIINESESQLAILNAGKDFLLEALEYENNISSRIVGGTGSTNIKVEKSLNNEGRIFSTGGTTNVIINDGKSSFTNSGQVAVNGKLNIKASEILIKAHTLVYSKGAMILDAVLGNIINEAGAEILTILGDMTLNAKKGNVYNKATARDGARIKSGGNLILTAINFYNEATQSRYQKEQQLPKEIMNGDTSLINKYFLQSDPLNKGEEYTESFSDDWVIQHFSTNIYYDKIFKTSPEIRRYIIENTYHSDYSYVRTSNGWEDLVGKSKFDVHYDLDRTLVFRKPDNIVESKQAILEAGKNLIMNLGENKEKETFSGILENKGIIRANQDINIKAGIVKNLTIEEQKNILDRMLIEFRLTIKTGHQTSRITNPYNMSIKKIEKLISYVSKNKALISAGRSNNISAGTIINTTSLNKNLDDSIRSNQGNVVYTEENRNTGAQENVTNQQAQQNTIEQPESPDEGRIKGVTYIVEPNESIILPSGENGLFRRNENIEMGDVYKPLFETNLEYINQKAYYGSKYVFEKLGINPDENMRRLGDNYYETRLVNDMYLKATGGRKTENGKIDEISLMKYLLDNSLLAQKELGLILGKELTKDQMSKLDRDIVWYVKQVVDGNEVLVPKVYITSNTIKKAKIQLNSERTGSVIKGEYVKINSSRFENIGGTIQGDSFVKIKAKDILNEAGENTSSYILGGNINLEAINDIKNIGGDILAEKTVSLKTEKGDIINETTKEKEEYFDGYKEKIKNIGEISGKNLVLNSGKDIKFKGGLADATEKMLIKAKRNISLDALKLEEKTERQNVYETFRDKKTKNIGSIVKAGKEISMIAKEKVDIKGSDVFSERGDIKIVGEEVTITAIKNISNSYYNKNKTMSLLDVDEETKTDYEEKLASSKIESKFGNVKISSNKDLNIIGSEIIGGGEENLLMSKEGSVNLKTLALKRNYKKDLKKKSFLKDSKSEVSDLITKSRRTVTGEYDDTGKGGSSNAVAGRFSSSGMNTGAEELHSKGYQTETSLSSYGSNGSAKAALFNQTIVKETLDAKVHAKTKINVGSMKVLSKKNINLESVDMDAENTLEFVAQEGNIISTYVQDEIKTSVEQDTISVGATASYTAEILSLLETVDKQVEYSKNSEYSSFNDKNTEGTGQQVGETFAKAAEMGGALSKVLGGSLFSVSAGVGVSVSHSEKTTEEKTALDSKINGKNILMKAKKGKVDLKGMQLEAKEDLEIETNEFNLEASENEYNEEESGYHTNVTSRLLASVNASKGADAGAELQLSLSTVNSHIKSKTYNNATLKGKNVKLNITNDAKIKGGNIKGDNVDAKIGGDLKIESVQDTLEQRLHSTDVDLVAGVSIDATGKVSGSGQVGATYGNVHEDKAWVKKQSGIDGGKVKLDVKGNTNLKGAKISADNGNLEFSTGSLSYENLKDTHERDGGYGGLGVSFSKAGVSGVDVKFGRVEGFHKAQNVNSTIGKGNITVGGKKIEETGYDINRDTSKSVETTKNEKHFKFDIDYTISPGDFKKNKTTEKTLRKRKENSGEEESQNRVKIEAKTKTEKITETKIVESPIILRKNQKTLEISESDSKAKIERKATIKEKTEVLEIKKETVEISAPNYEKKKLLVVKEVSSAPEGKVQRMVREIEEKFSSKPEGKVQRMVREIEGKTNSKEKFLKKQLVERDVYVKSQGTEKLLDSNTGKILLDKAGNEITRKSVEKISSKLETIDGKKEKGVLIELLDKGKLFLREDRKTLYRNSGNIKIKDQFKNFKEAVIIREERKEIEKIIDPETGKEISKEAFQNAKYDLELGGKIIDTEDPNRKLLLNDQGEIESIRLLDKEIIKEVEKYKDLETGKEISADEFNRMKKYNKELKQNALELESGSGRFLVNDPKKGMEIIQIQKINKEIEKKEYEISGENFQKKLTEDELKLLKENPELDGKIMNLEDDKILVLKNNGEGYITTREDLERKIAKETVETLIKNLLEKKDFKNIKEVLAQNKDNQLLDEETRRDYEDLYHGITNKKISKEEFFNIMKKYEETETLDYMDEDTGEIFDLEHDKFKKIKEIKEEIDEDAEGHEIKKTVYEKNGKGDYIKKDEEKILYRVFSKKKMGEIKKYTEEQVNDHEKIVIDKETGEVKLYETETAPYFNFFEGRKNWVIVKLFEKLKEKIRTKTYKINNPSNTNQEVVSSEELISEKDETTHL